jgi:hypothetical protein
MAILYRFQSVHQALEWFNNNNPARCKSLNLIECEIKSKPTADVFTGSHPADVWASICAALHKILRDHGYRAQVIFNLLYRGDRTERLAKEDIAQRFSVSKRQVNRLIREITDELEKELVRRELVPPLHRYFTDTQEK